MSDKEKAGAAVTTSVESLVKLGKVSHVQFVPGGGVELTVSVPHESLRAEGVRKTLATITDHMM